MTTSKLSRRQMLKFSSVAGAGAVLASFGPRLETAAASQPARTTTSALATNVVVMGIRGELSIDQEAQFETDHPDITIEFIENNNSLFYSMLAAGTPLDLYRTDGGWIPRLLYRSLLRDLTAYFNASTLVPVADLAEVNKYYWADSPFEIGAGKIYGMVKDWSPDFSLWVYDTLFDDAGVGQLDDTKVYSWQEIHDIAESIAVFTGEDINIWGYGYGADWIDRIIMNALAEKGKSLYKNSFSAIDWSEDAVAAARYFYDLAVEKLTISQEHPSPGGWIGNDFKAGILGIIQYGYWFGAMAESDTTRDHVRMIPSPSFSGVHRDPTMTGTGWIMLSSTHVPDAAWQVFEWYMGGQPSIDRAGSGWGIPSLKSQFHLMPNSTPFQVQVQKVLAGELANYGTPLQFNPYLGEGEFTNSWHAQLGEALAGTITFEEMLTRIETEVNAQIQVDRIYLPAINR